MEFIRKPNLLDLKASSHVDVCFFGFLRLSKLSPNFLGVLLEVSAHHEYANVAFSLS